MASTRLIAEDGLSGEAPSPSFAQTGAEFNLDDSDDIDDLSLDLRSQVLGGSGSGSSEAFEMLPRGGGGSAGGGSRDDLSLSGDYSSGAGRPRRWDADLDAAADDDLDDHEYNHDHNDGLGRSGRSPSASSTVASFELYTPDEEATVRRKFDRKLVLFVALLYMLSFLDRSNIGNARIAGMDEDLQTDPPRDDWYEWALTAFYITYIAFEWLSLAWSLVPAHILVSVIVLTWGLTASLQAVAPSYPVLVALRALLGVGEAGFTGIPLYLSFFYKRHELAFRTAIFISAAPLATSFAATLAWLLLRLAEVTPIAPWRLLFLVEGFPSVIAAVVAWNVIPDSPQSASYLTRREKRVARLRLRGERGAILPASASTTSTRPTSRLRVWDVLAVLGDPVAWITAAMFFLSNMAYSSLPVFLPKILTEMGHSDLAAQALSAPPYLVTFVLVLFTAHLSDRVRSRTAPLLFHALASTLGYGLLALAEPLSLPPWLRYLAVYPAAVGFFNVVTLLIAWTINNQAGPSRQGGGFALFQLVGQCGPLVGTRLYPDRDGPYYSPGMRACACAMLGVSLLAVVLRFYLKYQNRKMDLEESEKANKDTAVEEEGLVGHGRRRKTPAEAFRYML